MWHARQVLKFALGLLGAVILSAGVAAASARGGDYPRALLSRLCDFAHFDFGASSISGLSATHLVIQRLPATLGLMLSGAVVAFGIGAPLGVLLGRGRALRWAAPLIQVLAAPPVFCAGLGLSWLSSQLWHIPYAWPHDQGGASVLSAVRAVALPGLTVGAAGAAAVQLVVRRAESAAIEEPYRHGLRLLGLGRFEIDRLYLAPQVFAATLASLGEIVLALFSAAAVAEWLFGWPGAAVLFLKSVALHDWNVAGLVLLAFAVVSLAADFCGVVVARALGGARPS